MHQIVVHPCISQNHLQWRRESVTSMNTDMARGMKPGLFRGDCIRDKLSSGANFFLELGIDRITNLVYSRIQEPTLGKGVSGSDSLDLWPVIWKKQVLVTHPITRQWETTLYHGVIESSICTSGIVRQMGWKSETIVLIIQHFLINWIWSSWKNTPPALSSGPTSWKGSVWIKM